MVIESLKSIQLGMTKHPSRKVMNLRHLLGCDTINDNNLRSEMPKKRDGRVVTDHPVQTICSTREDIHYL